MWETIALMVLVGIVWIVACRNRVCVLGGTRYEICRVSCANDSFEYRTASVLPLTQRGDVRLFRDGNTIRAVSLRHECSPEGLRWANEQGELRTATPDEIALFHQVCLR